MTVASTFPAAAGLFYGYMQTAAAAFPAMNLGVFFGFPVENITAQYLQLGRYEDGLLAAEDAETDWDTFPVAAKRRTEKYSLYGCIRTWSGETDPQGRLNDCFALYGALYEQVLSDPRGNGLLTPSGSWARLGWRVKEFGPLGQKNGWGCVLDLELSLANAITVG